jgi:hypothetical protein
MKGGNPKSEIRSPKEGRNPKSECGCKPRSAETLAFELRPSDLLRISDFGFRILVATLFLLAVPPSFAATNAPTNGDIPPLRPPHAELAPTYWEQHGTAVVLCGVLFLILVGAAIWLLTRPKPPVVVPPEVLARKALEPLGERPEDGALLSQVSRILRHYLSAAFNLPPEELTTTEFCRAIASHEQIGAELSVALSEFLLKCDQRKFAPPAPAPPLSVVDQALKLIDQAQARRTART